MKKIILTILVCVISILSVTGCEKNNDIEEFIIVDKTNEIKDFMCAEVLENFYNDDNYSYYWSCMKDNYIVVKYKDGNEQKVSDALKNKKISIIDLDRFNIKYYKQNN